MKKLFLFFALLAGAVAGPQIMAETLRINGKQFDTSAHISNMSVDGKTSGTISWDAGYKRLTFNNVVMNATSDFAVYFSGDHITLAFEGKNVIKSSYTCFDITASNYCNIRSREEYGPHAYLELESTNSSFGHCVSMKGMGSLTVSSIYLKGTTKNGHVFFGSGNNIKFLTAWVQMKAQGTSRKALLSFYSCEIGEGCYLEKGSFNTSLQSFHDGTYMQEVNILPELTVGGVIVNTEMGGEDGSLPVAPKGKTSGSISWNSLDNSLYFNKVVGTIGDTNLPNPYGTALVHNSKVEGLLVQVKGANTITSPTVSDYYVNYCVFSNEKISINGAEKWGDIASNSLRWSSIAGFVGNFVYPYLMYLFWTKLRKKPFNLRRGRTIGLFVVTIIVCTLVKALMISSAVAFHYPDVDVVLFFASVLLNDALFPIGFAIPFIIMLQEELGFKPLGPKSPTTERN